MKRFRDADGTLTISLEELCEITREEGDRYYQDGGIYVFSGKRYICHRTRQGIYFSGCNTINCDLNRIGTFLPDVASDGLEIVKLEDDRNLYGIDK